MNKHLELLRELDLDLFYVVTIYRESIKLQGQANSKTIKYSKLLVDLKFNKETNFLGGSDGKIEITLTF